MPERSFNPNARTYYLDTSTLSDIHNASRGDARTPIAYARLLPWLTRVAHDANLCLSVAHVGECSDRPQPHADSFVEWIDAIPFTWALPVEEIERAEIDALVWSTVGLEGGPTVLPFAHRGHSFPGMVAAAREAGWEAMKQLPFHMTDAMQSDIAEREAAGASESEVAQGRIRKRRLLIRELSADAHAFFILNCGPDYTTAVIGRRIADEAVELCEGDAKWCRTLRVSLGAAAEVERNARSRDAGSRTEKKQLEGFAGDELHAIAGAAYCDVFNCDRRTAVWVAPLRAQFGLPAPLVSGGHPRGVEGFVDDLLGT